MSERQDPWELVTAKRYVEAAEAYSRRYAEGGGTFALRGWSRALLWAGRPAEALDRIAADSPEAVLRARRQCQADFVAAVRALREQNASEFRDRMTRCAGNPHGELEREFCLARWEVANSRGVENA